MHDLCLAIGGMTVTEMKGRMTLQERADWITYMQTRGPVNPLLRMDAAIARSVIHARGGKVEDLMPWPREPEPEATPEALFALFTRAAANNRKPN